MGRPVVERSGDALDRFERVTAWPMLVLSLAIIPLLVIPLAVELAPATETAFLTIDWIIWAAFALEYGIRLYLAPATWLFVRSNVIDLVVVVIPFLRPLRVVRSARALRLLRLARIGAFGFRAIDAIRDVLTRHKLGHTALVALLVTVACAGLVYEFEKSVPAAERNITSFPTALWWAVTTITTVGYGDSFPHSAAGRGIAVVLMFVGVGLFGILAASLASYFVERDQSADQQEESSELGEILKRLERIEHHLGSAPGDAPEDRA